MYGKVNKKCIICGVVFEASGRNQKYCGSRKLRTGCSWLRQQQWSYNSPAHRNRRINRDLIPNRLQLIADLGGMCRICLTTEKLTINHIRPVSAGGSSELSNFEVLCGRCNTQEYHKLYKIALLYYFENK